MVNGTTLRLPGEFFIPSPTTSLPDPSEFLNKLKASFRTLAATPPRLTNRNANVPGGLSTATHVFVRHDAVKRPLQPPYDGPYKVVKRTDKHFTLSINGRNDTVSIDRLKPAHLDIIVEHSTPTISNPTAQPPITSRTTRSGRRVHFPDYLSLSV